MTTHKTPLIRPLSIAGIVFVLVFLVAGLAATEAEDHAGKGLYSKNCEKCHGAEGRAETRAGQMLKTPDLNTHEWKNGKSVEGLMKTLGVKMGRMPSFADKLNEEERKAVAEYTLSLLEDN